MRWEEMTTPQFAAAVKKAGGVGILPIGVLEAHSAPQCTGSRHVPTLGGCTTTVWVAHRDNVARMRPLDSPALPRPRRAGHRPSRRTQGSKPRVTEDARAGK